MRVRVASYERVILQFEQDKPKENVVKTAFLLHF